MKTQDASTISIPIDTDFQIGEWQLIDLKYFIDNAENHYFFGQAQVNDCTIYAQAPSEEQLGEVIDSMILIVLDNGLHSTAGKTTKICNTDFFLN